MKKLFTLMLAAVTAAAAFAQRPLLVGHRGSNVGVENSVQSFTEGAKRGYEFLETDFKVTKDGQLVCSHDDDTSRLGDKTVSIAGGTLAEIQAVTLTQTRDGVKYTGRVCSAQEYLDVCKEYNVRPLIELKWATGINNNDCSNIPMLIKFIESNGFRDKCIILTSMKPCLEYIRKNYPDIELQFLTGQYWASHFDWCVTLGIDVDIQSGYFDKTTVQKYHDEGLKVNMWTTNTNEGYSQYGNWGCDFITTDKLDPATLPELDPSATFPPNTVDYPNSEGKIRGNYDHEKVVEISDCPVLAGRSVKKALFAGGAWIVLSTAADGSSVSIDRIDPLTGQSDGAYNLAGTENIGDIAMTADGVLIASTLAAVPLAGGGDTFRLYSWDSKTASAKVFFSSESADNLGGWADAALGDHIAVSGRLKDLKVYFGSKSASTGDIRLAALWFQKGEQYKYAYATDAPYTADKWGDYTITVTPTNRDCIIINSPVLKPVEYRFEWDKTGEPMTVYANFADGAIKDHATGLAFYRRGAKVYGFFPDCAEDGTAFTGTVYDVTAGISTASAVTAPLHEGLGTTAGAYAVAAITAAADGNIHVHLLNAADGLATIALATGANDDETPKEVDLELQRDWIFSNTTGNHPGNIDGTNAQQGTAVNGYFYINNCVEKKLHIFNETGYLGSIPGGAGWGTARDDAGNIVVRDDKLSGNSHNFIVYPAGATPDNYREPVTFTADVVYEGQTNFINAGGDLLGGTGHIYLYPNKQTAVNIITVTKGQVTASKGYADLKVAGSTAGYVIPINDDTENWIYNIRANGLYLYNGGTTTDLSTDRSGTTPPQRNTTGGGAYFSLSGNKILVHNSGTNYKGGFTIKNTSKNNEVVATVSPIGSLGYETGGNYSTFNWIIPERVSDGVYNLYQYCPANGIAKYTLVDKLNDVKHITVPADEVAFNVYADHNSLVVSGIEVHNLRVYNLAGVLVANADAQTADISALAPGIYIVTVNNVHSAKFLKK